MWIRITGERLILALILQRGDDVACLSIDEKALVLTAAPRWNVRHIPHYRAENQRICER